MTCIDGGSVCEQDGGGGACVSPQQCVDECVFGTTVPRVGTRSVKLFRDAVNYGGVPDPSSKDPSTGRYLVYDFASGSHMALAENFQHTYSVGGYTFTAGFAKSKTTHKDYNGY